MLYNYGSSVQQDRMAMGEIFIKQKAPVLLYAQKIKKCICPKIGEFNLENYMQASHLHKEIPQNGFEINGLEGIRMCVQDGKTRYCSSRN
ncbi:hypothetical protein FGO68_gene1669 [Halteria grandinella]|uniref:Uncharacterized protein n=1 Tax=Halteria grandinella TaxID=5974 RepID=A0A8J8N8Y4_HALGN|nr:hypothetical protein FGO68_gene1669 [Halteria grandinella]